MKLRPSSVSVTVWGAEGGRFRIDIARIAGSGPHGRVAVGTEEGLVHLFSESALAGEPILRQTLPGAASP